MRKRAQRKSIPTQKETTAATSQSSRRMPFKFKKNWWIVVSLVAIFLLVLFLNSYFNVSSGATFNPDGTGFEQYYLSGPDPYYNMRIVDQTMYGDNPGYYQFYNENDPLLNYPLGRSGGRGPLLNMMAIGFGTLLSPVMSEVDAVGIAMQFIPALFGALLVFPVYFIGKTLFGKKEGLLAALLVALIPIHLGSGHGSAFSLFDHDSLNLLLFFITYFFLIKAIKETDTTKSILYALLGGIPLAGLSMVWVEYEFLYTVIAVYAVVQMIIDIFTSKIDIRVPRSVFITLLTGYLVSLPLFLSKGGFSPDIPLFLCLGIGVFGLIYLFLKRKNIPWTLSLPTLFILGAAAVTFLFFVPTLAESIPALSPLNKFSDILFGAGIYGKKVSLTIAEAGTYDISRTVMSFGPALFWLTWIGFAFIGYHYLKHVNRRDMLFFLVLFLIQIWFIGIAGRFMNDLVPFVALFSAWLILYIMRKFDYQTMIKNIKSAGSGIRGLRKGVSFLHIFGILFVALLVFFPNAYLSLDAAVPAVDKQEVFGDLPAGAFGGGIGKEIYWVNAFSWLADQDTEIDNPVDRPAFISWWDYGFYGSAVSGHPMVADNFQDGIPPASNFHISTSEKEAVSIWAIRLLEGNVEDNNGKLDPSVVTALETYLDANDSEDLVYWVENPEQSPSYGQPIAAQYNPNISKNYPVGEQWPMNAV
ncbi:MAG: STT3 domain-containing protein, partial [Thermoplasmatota archaeon]